MRRLSVLAAVAGAALVAGCGSGHKSAAPATTVPAPSAPTVATTTVPATAAPPATTAPGVASTTTVPTPKSVPTGNGAEYLAIVNSLISALGAAPASPTPAQFKQLASEVGTAQARLTAVAWPGQAEADIRTLVTELTPLAAALAAGDAGAVNSTAGALTSASVTIRTDLGLPPGGR